MGESIQKKEEKYKDFYQKLRDKINRWAREGSLEKKRGKWTDKFLQYLLVLPDLVYLMIKLFVDKEISSVIKGYILMLFVYLISPIDIIPDFLPVIGFIDDLMIITVILNKIINSADEKVLTKIKNYWTGEDDVFVKVKEIINTMNQLSSQIPKAIYKFMKEKK